MRKINCYFIFLCALPRRTGAMPWTFRHLVNTELIIVMLFDYNSETTEVSMEKCTYSKCCQAALLTGVFWTSIGLPISSYTQHTHTHTHTHTPYTLPHKPTIHTHTPIHKYRPPNTHIHTQVASLFLGMLLLTAVPWGVLKCPGEQSGQKSSPRGRVEWSRYGVQPLRPLEKLMLQEAHPGSLCPYLLTLERGNLAFGIKKHLEGSIPILWVQSLFLTIWPR